MVPTFPCLRTDRTFTASTGLDQGHQIPNGIVRPQKTAILSRLYFRKTAMKPPVLESGTSVKMWGMEGTGIIRLSGTVALPTEEKTLMLIITAP